MQEKEEDKEQKVKEVPNWEFYKPKNVKQKKKGTIKDAVVCTGIGFVMMVGGIWFSFFSYALASNGGVYFIAWVPVVVGGLIFIAGIAFFLQILVNKIRGTKK